MDTLPLEFLSHQRPLIFFAGINPSPSPSSSTPSIIQSNSNDQSSQNQTVTTAVATDQIEILCNNLRQVVGQKDHGSSIWDPKKPHENVPEFRILLVDKTIRFPPRKARPNSVTGSTNVVAHSPLSPLSTTSPLFPDGIMTPIWIRKHRDMIPSVFVLSLRLWEPASLQGRYKSVGNGSGPPEKADQNEVEQQSKADHELIYEIVERKRTTSERGIKLVVIILTSREMLDSPNLDLRLSYIRKQSGLDSRASLFVLSPVPQADVLEFFNTLKAELYESSIDFYREHSRRVRRKRSRSSSNASVHSTIYSQPGQPVIVLLGPQGWSVRADYKLATFAEFRQEYEVALKSYEDCWEGLSQMFSSTAVLPPRTKRWAEAKVLIDCISVKICKLYLYSNEHSRAMNQFHRHTRRFRDLCNGWGIGEETYELWAWLSKQYNIFADLVDIACRSGMRLPSLLPTQNSLQGRTPASIPFMPSEVPGTGRNVSGGGVNVANVLVHPGFYYYQSAQCSVERRERFRLREAGEQEMRLVFESENPGKEFHGSLALAHERKVNHTELIINIYTKAYEIFKSVGATRMTLFLAFKIALVHLDREDHETSIKFLERLINSYQKDNFQPIADNILSCYQGCLKKKLTSLQGSEGEMMTTSDFRRMADFFKLSLELAGRSQSVHSETFQEDSCKFLSSLLKTPSKVPLPVPSLISFDLSPKQCLVKSQVIFWKPSVEVGEEVEFQVTMKINGIFGNSEILFDSVEIRFSSEVPVISLEDVEENGSDDVRTFKTFELGEISQEAITKKFDLRTSKSGRSTWLVLGRLRPKTVGDLSLERTRFRLRGVEGAPNVEFSVNDDGSSGLLDKDRFGWVSNFDEVSGELNFLRSEAFQSICRVQPKMPRFDVFIIYDEDGLTEEERIMELSISSMEEFEPINVKFEVQLASEFSGDKLSVEDYPEGIDFDKFLNLGTLQPRSTIKRRLKFLPSKDTGLRELRLNFKGKVISGEMNDEVSSKEEEGEEEIGTGTGPSSVDQIHKEVFLNVEEPLQLILKTKHFNEFRLEENVSKKMRDLELDEGFSGLCIRGDSSCRALLSFDLRCNARFDLVLRKFDFCCEKSSVPIRICSSTLIGFDEDCEEIELSAGTNFQFSYVVEIEDEVENDFLTGNFLRTSWSRKSKSKSLKSSNKETNWHEREIEVLIRSPLRRMANVVTNLPSHIKLYEPIEIDYRVQNFDRIHTLDLIVQVEPSNDQWVYSGFKRIDQLLVLPRSNRSFKLYGLPTAMGEIEGPKVQVFQRVYDHQNRKLSQSLKKQPQRDDGKSFLVSEILSSEEEDDDRKREGEDDDDDNESLGGLYRKRRSLNSSSNNGGDEAQQEMIKLVEVEIFRVNSLIESDPDDDKVDESLSKSLTTSGNQFGGGLGSGKSFEGGGSFKVSNDFKQRGLKVIVLP